MRNFWLIKSVPDRFAQNSTYIPFCGCRLWFGPSVPKGYGVISYQGKQVYAHRLAWQLENGQIPIGAMVLHDCDMPGCINPEHLYVGSPQDNMNDKAKRNRCNSPKGERHLSAKLTEAQVREIRSTFIPHHPLFSTVALGRKYGVGPNTITNTVKRTTWRHI